MSNFLCRRLLFTSRGEIFGQWNVEFTYTWAELKEKPKLSAKGIEVCLKEKEKKKFLFGSSTSKKEIHISDKKLAEVLSVCMQVWLSLFVCYSFSGYLLYCSCANLYVSLPVCLSSVSLPVCLSLCLSVSFVSLPVCCLSLYPSVCHLSVYLSVCLSTRLSSVSIHLSLICPYLSVICLSTCLSAVSLPVCLWFVSLPVSVCLSVCLSLLICLSDCLSLFLYPSACLSLYPPVCLLTVYPSV